MDDRYHGMHDIPPTRYERPYSLNGAGLIRTREQRKCFACDRTIRKGTHCYRLRQR